MYIYECVWLILYFSDWEPGLHLSVLKFSSEKVILEERVNIVSANFSKSWSCQSSKLESDTMSVFHTVTQRSVQTDEICYKNVKKKIAKYIFLHLVWVGLYTEKKWCRV